MFQDFGEGFRVYLISLVFIYGVLFAKVTQTLFQHRSEKRKPFGVLQSDVATSTDLPRISIFLDLVKDLLDS